MTSTDANRRNARRNRPDLSTILVNVAAGVATLSSYTAIVGFAQVVLEMDPIMAYTLSGVFELSMVALALKARNAVRDGRPHFLLSVLAACMAVASGIFAGWEEIHLGHPVAAAGFRFLVAITGAVLWEISLVGEAHLAAGVTWTQARINRRMQALQEATEALFRATENGNKRSIRRRERELIRARRRARRVVTPEDMRRHAEAQQDSADALVNHLAFTRSGHERIRAAYDGRGVQAPRIERRATVRAITPTPTSDATPDANPDAVSVASSPDATEAETPAVAAAIAPAPRTTVTASVDDRPTGPGAPCWGCGRPNRGAKTRAAKFCQYDDAGAKSQACKHLYNEGNGYYAKPSAGSVGPVAAIA